MLLSYERASIASNKFSNICGLLDMKRIAFFMSLYVD